MSDLKFDSGSFRDPAGKIFYKNNKVYRKLFKSSFNRFEFLKDNGLLKDLIEKEYIVDTKECESSELGLQSNINEKILAHEKINFISYPYEWTFNQLKDAALFHLDLQLYLLAKNAKLIDASAFNIQFKDNKPILIDVLSIDKYEEGEYWYGHKQFCENFLNPLILSSKKGIKFNNWFRGNLEGIHTDEIIPILNFIDLLSPTLFFHVYLMNKFEEKSKKNPKKINSKIKDIKKFSKKSYENILNQLRNYIKKLNNKKKASNWESYSSENTYDTTEEKKKLDIIKKFVEENNPKSLVDLGCNDGKYSEYASLEKKIKVTGIDFDLNALDRAYLNSKKKNFNFFPIYSDFSNPSTNLGWNEAERKSLIKRSSFDSVIALALVHHLIIAKNLPIDEVISWITSFGSSGLVEFVPKDDPTVKIMLQLKGDIFPDYNENNFREILSKYVNIKKVLTVTSSNRKIFEFSKK